MTQGRRLLEPRHVQLQEHLQFSVANAGASTQTPLDYAWSITANQWYNLAVTHSGMSWTLYIDGSSAQTDTSTVVLPSLSGNALNVGSTAFAGNIDSLQLFHTALTSTSIGDIAGGTYTPVTPYTTNENTALTISGQFTARQRQTGSERRSADGHRLLTARRRHSGL